MRKFAANRFNRPGNVARAPDGARSGGFRASGSHP